MKKIMVSKATLLRRNALIAAQAKQIDDLWIGLRHRERVIDAYQEDLAKLATVHRKGKSDEINQDQ